MKDLHYKISLDYNKLTKEQKEVFKQKLYQIILKELEEQFLTEKIWDDEQFEERFNTTDRQHVLNSNIHYLNHSTPVLEWIADYGNKAKEFSQEFGITLPETHNYIYTVEVLRKLTEVQYKLKYCSPNYEDSLSELKRLAEKSYDGRARLVS